MTGDVFSLAGRVIVITGAAGLLGRQHAAAVACAGGTPVLLDLHGKPLTDLATELNIGYHVPAAAFVVDVTKEAEVEANCAARWWRATDVSTAW